MKILYKRKLKDGTQQAGLDLADVFHFIVVDKEDGQVFILQLRGNNIDTVEQVPQYNKAGKITEFRPTKMSVNPSVELHFEEDQVEFLKYWN